METFWGSGQEGEKTLVQVCWFAHLWDVHLKPRHVLGTIFLPLTVPGIHSSFTSLSPTIDLLLSSYLPLPLAPLQFLFDPPATS